MDRRPVLNGRVPTSVRRIRAPTERGEAFDLYLALCGDYVKRQALVYSNWPQRRWDATGYRDEKVFSDRNA